MSRAPAITTILFDVGGVLVTLDGVPSLAGWLGVEPSHDSLHRLWMASAAVVAHETGRIGPERFAEDVVADLGLAITPAEFLEDFRRWPGAPQRGALELLDAIPSRYRVAALSNTSAVHWERIVAMGVTRRFEHAFLSHEIGHLKPSREAFLHALDALGAAASDVLFIDDSRRNAEAAASLGMHARVAADAQDARIALAEFGVVSG